ncbi:MAG: fdrA domain protein [Candidatus Muiribacterium halophilum]|uniref:FdrA domain protein n=1 Tax=Muiribacterium halophilum TaxID=2053465 RepID=A0A2N5ZM31_MUIH1|nr:MAG: fdrA domain protein [Candidatus Muirbacterium halophilum]
MEFKLFKEELKVVNIGLASFGENLKNENTKVVSLKWAPPALGDQKLFSLVKKYKRLSEIEYKG